MNTDTAGEMVFCRACGRKIHNSATACPSCGAVQSPAMASATEKKILTALLLCFFFGWLGVHRFYVHKVGTGVIQMLTFGGLGIWMFIDFILIVMGEFKDKQGNKLSQWT